MDIDSDWNAIRKHFNTSFKSNFHVSVASVDSENNPTVTPIGSLFLNDDRTGFYFEKYPVKLPIHAENNTNICVLAVNSGTSFWLKALFSGKFTKPPAIKIYGHLGKKRRASQKEISRLKRRMKVTQVLKGNRYLWGDMEYIRELKFTWAEKINLGQMTRYL